MKNILGRFKRTQVKQPAVSQPASVEPSPKREGQFRRIS